MAAIVGGQLVDLEHPMAARHQPRRHRGDHRLVAIGRDPTGKLKIRQVLTRALERITVRARGDAMTRALVVLTILLTAGCGPTLIGANERSVMVGNANWTNAGDAFAMAERACAKFGKHARLAVTDPWSYQQSFDCL